MIVVSVLAGIWFLSLTAFGQRTAVCGQAGNHGARGLVNAWPWQVLLCRSETTAFMTYKRGRLGGGTLINNRWVLTAAHVFENSRLLNDWPRNVLLTMGIHRFPIRRPVTLSPSTRVFLSDDILIHEHFNRRELNYDYDIALIKIGRRKTVSGDRWVDAEGRGWVNYSPSIKPVCLPCLKGNCVGKHLERLRILSGDETEDERCRKEGAWLLQARDGEEVNTTITGFDFKYPVNQVELQHSNKVKQGLITLWSENKCRLGRNELVSRQGLRENIQFTENMICGIGSSSGDVVNVCEGESGSPLVRKVLTDRKSGCWVQLGIISWGGQCDSSEDRRRSIKYYASFFTKVTTLIGWVSGKINGETNCIIQNPPRNGFVSSLKGNVRPGNTITYECQRGFRVSGQATLACLRNGSWSGTVPECVEEIDCHQNNPRFGSSSTDSRYTNPGFIALGGRLTYTCNHGYEMEGQPSGELTVTCQRNGRWSQSLPTCARLGCTVPRRARAVVASTTRLTLKVGETVTYTCIPGHYTMNRPHESLTSTCRNDGSWSAGVPTCRQREKVCISGGEHCTFPFNYRGISHYSCTTVDNHGIPWCYYYTGRYVTSLDPYEMSNDRQTEIVQKDNCRHCPASWYNWQQWSGCSVSCGIGNRRRNRRCRRGGAGDDYCPGSDEELQECDVGRCAYGVIGPYKSVEIGSSLYAIFLLALTRNGALRHCEAFGGSLAKIPSFEVNRRLFDEIRKLPRNPYQGSPSYHIGMNDIKREGYWYWPDGSIVPLHNWQNREPNNGGGRHGEEDCGVLVVRDGRWNDVSCNRRDYFICQKTS